jgi:hypothetical protein
MKAWGYYTVAALLTLATFPMYRYMYIHAHEHDALPVSSAQESPPPVSYIRTSTGRLLPQTPPDVQRQVLRYFDRIRLAANQRCYGGAIIEKNGSTYTSVNGVDGRHATCKNGFSDVPIR